MYCIKYSESIVERRIAYSDLSRDLCRLRLLSRLRLRFFELQQHTMINVKLLSYGMNTAEALELRVMPHTTQSRSLWRQSSRPITWMIQTKQYNTKSKQHKIQQNYASSFASYDTRRNGLTMLLSSHYIFTRKLCYRKDHALYKWIKWAVVEIWPFEICRQLKFDVTKNSAIRSADPENPILKPNMKCIGSAIAEIWPFSYLVGI